MAMTATTVRQGVYSAEFDIIATLDADLTVTFNHGLQGVPNMVALTPLQGQAYVGSFTVGVLTATQITINKTNAAGSGSLNPTVRVQAIRYHSIMQ